MPADAFSTPRKKLALITGGNKGIGKEIARRIGTSGDFTAIVACRNITLGHEAVKDLVENGEFECDAICCPVPLDLTDTESIANAAKWVEGEYNGVLDVLINNAAICFNSPTLYGKLSEPQSFEQQAGITIQTNYFGTLEVTNAFLPLLQKSDSPRIINIASAAGRLSILRSQELVDKFTSNDLTIPQLSSMMEQFLSNARDGTHGSNGWPNTCYGVSKIGVIAQTRVLARQYPNMMINSVDPGYCKTDQNDNMGTVDASDGAYTPLLLAMMERDDGEEICSGLHYYLESEMSWDYSDIR